jgi:putative redox protein
MDAKVIWKTGLSFTGTSDSGFTLPMGSKSETGTPNDGFRPVELLAIGLAGCTAMDVISILEKKQEKVSAFEVTVHAVRATEHPRVFTQAEIVFHLIGTNIDPMAVQRAIELSSKKYCPAHAMLEKAFPIKTRYEITETNPSQ